MMKLSTADFQLFRDFINEKTGIYLREEKAYFLVNRLEARMKETNCDQTQDYFRMLKYDTASNELQALTEALTTNETYFFRDIKQLNAFSLEALPMVLERKKAAGDCTLNIWSAGCSTGEEPYTIAMLVNEVAKGMKVKIVASDINTRVLGVAKKAVYSGRSLKDVPAYYLDKYFTHVDEVAYEVVPEIRSQVEFMILNLVDKNRLRLMYNFDFILCRNVLIYFTQAMGKQIINSFYDSLNRGGFIFLGLAESMHLFSGAFKLVKFKELFGYMKDFDVQAASSKVGNE